jgi:hypothetical protein
MLSLTLPKFFTSLSSTTLRFSLSLSLFLSDAALTGEIREKNKQNTAIALNVLPNGAQLGWNKEIPCNFIVYLFQIELFGMRLGSNEKLKSPLL